MNGEQTGEEEKEEGKRQKERNRKGRRKRRKSCDEGEQVKVVHSMNQNRRGRRRGRKPSPARQSLHARGRGAKASPQPLPALIPPTVEASGSVHTSYNGTGTVLEKMRGAEKAFPGAMLEVPERPGVCLPRVWYSRLERPT